jgi:AAA+ ATPase superfamily predicted ATPase
MRTPENPFLTSGYFSPEYFCDREIETKQLLNSLQNGQNVTLTSIRRIGKTGLIKHLFYQLPENWKGIYIDILSTENLSQFLNSLTSSILNAVPEKENLGQKIWNFVKSMRPVISFDPLTNLPQATFELRQTDTEMHINSIMQFLEKQDLNFVIAIDEFQQITNYPEKNTDALLRSIIQHMNNVRFIFSGSQQHILNELFNLPSRPFFRSTRMQKIDKIDQSEYRAFISRWFSKSGISISDEIINDLLQWSCLHTYYVQLIFNRVFSTGQTQITEDIWKEEAYKLLKEQETVFYNYRNMLTQPQWHLLKSIAHEGSIQSPTSKDFIHKYNLGSPSTVLRSLNSLLKNELLYSSFAEKGIVSYSIYDILLHRWTELSTSY